MADESVMTKQKRKGIRSKQGDLFEMSVGAGQVALGHLLLKVASGKFYIGVYGGEIPGEASVEEKLALKSNGLDLLAQSLDGKLWHGMWPIIGNAPAPEGVPYPAYVVRRLSNDGAHSVWLTDHLGRMRRRATRSEESLLTLNTTDSAQRLENAATARRGRRAWEEDYDRFLLNHARAYWNFVGVE